MPTYVRLLIEMTSVESGSHRVSQDLFALKKSNEKPKSLSTCIYVIITLTIKKMIITCLYVRENKMFQLLDHDNYRWNTQMQIIINQTLF